MSKKVIPISVRAYAKQLNVAENAVREAIKKGKIKKGYDVITKKINPVIANKEYGFIHSVVKPRPGQSRMNLLKKVVASEGKVSVEKNTKPEIDSDIEEDSELISSLKIHKDMPLSEILRRREIISLVQDRAELRELEGLLVRKDLIDSVLFALGSELKKALFNIPSRIAADMRAAENDAVAHTVMTIELTQVLTEFSKMVDIKTSVSNLKKKK